MTCIPLRLVIKGHEPATACAFARLWGLDPTNAIMLSHDRVLLLATGTQRAAMDWLAGDSEHPPFPPGTCLFWTTEEATL